MPLFTRCKIDLGGPQDVFVKFKSKIPNRSFIITAGKCHFWGVFKKELFGVYRVAFTSLCITYLLQ